MRAVAMKEFGAPQVLQLAELPDVAAGAGEVAIDVEFANVTFVETQIRAGRPPNPAMLPTLPAVLGNGVGGTVTEAGPGADPALVGRRVVASLTGTGGYAEQAVAAEQRL
ncbi:MAG TPA: alcohol dehydrogenase catalytic domain-containing protein, partial [Streptosporangiaceae bacterium]|nr:alcohol dehydrogenase catalytic domain-containing protein [Streptosporangiaceae bacterium]